MATVLIVDDSPLIRRAVSFALEKNGYITLTAVNGREALDYLSVIAVDLVCTDINMPEMDGFTLLRQLRSSRLYQSLPVIMLVNNEQEHVCSIAKAEGANGFLIKPTTSQEVVDIVYQVLN